VYSVFCIILCIVSPFVYSCLFLIFVQVYRPLPQDGNPIAVKTNHIVSSNYNEGGKGIRMLVSENIWGSIIHKMLGGPRETQLPGATEPQCHSTSASGENIGLSAVSDMGVNAILTDVVNRRMGAVGVVGGVAIISTITWDRSTLDMPFLHVQATNNNSCSGLQDANTLVWHKISKR